MTADQADYRSTTPVPEPASVDEVFRDAPVQSARDLTCDGIFDTEDELDEFLEHVRTTRRADLA